MRSSPTSPTSALAAAPITSENIAADREVDVADAVARLVEHLAEAGSRLVRSATSGLRSFGGQRREQTISAATPRLRAPL